MNGLFADKEASLKEDRIEVYSDYSSFLLGYY